MTNPTLLAMTLAAATKDRVTTRQDGTFVEPRPDGQRERTIQPIIDDRGSLFEIWDRRWSFDDHPVEHIYCATLRPGVVKGWALHKTHEDRYFIIKGVLRLILYDVRPESQTCGQVFVHSLSEHARRLITIPINVWHADHNVGTDEAYLLNLPTRPFDHSDPDKFRLPINTDLIPYRFPATATGY